MPPVFPRMSARRAMLWHFLAGTAIVFGIWYLSWRWSVSLNPNAMWFSIAVAAAETAAFVGTCLFFFDIWSERDTPQAPPPKTRKAAGLEGPGNIRVDIFITTFDEGTDIVGPSISDAKAVRIPPGAELAIHVLDDGQQTGMRALAEEAGVVYHARFDNVGYKAGNMRQALLRTDGDFVVICDADTRLFPDFLLNTLGYFRDTNVAWVQTPHWFYDIPSGQTCAEVLSLSKGPLQRFLDQTYRALTGRATFGRDPFLADPALFFDVIQRRRNRHGASFCCGAGSIHRREAVFADALSRRGHHAARFLTVQGSAGASRVLQAVPLEPFCFHVSEDILTSIHLHERGWTSVYHPQVEARMLSPWSMAAWSTQQLKYAGGTFDIMLRHNPLFRRGMPWRRKLHYAATFQSYLAVLWMPVLLAAPILSLFLGIAPVDSYSIAFFAHLLPMLITNELAGYVGCKGHDTFAGRLKAIGAVPFFLRAATAVARGRRPRFPPTPKTPGRSRDWSRGRMAMAFITLSLAAGIWGAVAYLREVPGYSLSLLTANTFWLLWNCYAFLIILRMCAWLPDRAPSQSTSSSPEIGGSHAQIAS